MKVRTTTTNLRRFSTPALVLLLAVGMIGFTGCDVFIDDGEPSHSSRVELRLNAEPIPIDFVDEANVTITRTELIRENSGRVTVSNDDRTINLLDLTDGASALLGEENVRPGVYEAAWLYIDDAEIVLDDGTTFEVDAPNQPVKINFDDVRIRGNERVRLTFTIDTDDSFEVEGDAGSPDGITGFNFDPDFISTDVDRDDWNRRDDDEHDDDDDDGDHDD